MTTYRNLNSAWINICATLFATGEKVNPRNLECKEKLNVAFTLENPRERIVNFKARKISPFYLVGEVLWYLSKSNKLEDINYYSKFWNKCSDDGKTLNSAYGYRIFAGDHSQIPFDQFAHVCQLLKDDPYSRQAIIHFKTPSNVKTKDEVCTLSMQFFIRQKKLHATVVMRSNDIIFGTTYDVYFFTLLQEMLAVKLGVGLGTYTHFIGSLHLYKNKYDVGEKCLLDSKNMSHLDAHAHPVMQKEFINNIPLLLSIERYLRTTDVKDIYWNLPLAGLHNMDDLSKTYLILLWMYKAINTKFFELIYEMHNQHIASSYLEILDNFIENKNES